MKVVDRTSFLKLPAGTIYCKGKQWYFDNLCIKDDSLPNDWIYLNPAWAAANDSGEALDMLERSLQTGASFPCEDAFGRDGSFDDGDIFLIFELEDLTSLKRHIETAIEIATAQPTLALLELEQTGDDQQGGALRRISRRPILERLQGVRRPSLHSPLVGSESRP